MAVDKYIFGHFVFYIILLFTLVLSCTPAFYLKNTPNITESYFKRSVEKIDAKIKENPQDMELLIEGMKLHTQYAYGFLLEKADRKIYESYSTALRLYKEASTHFISGENYGLKILNHNHPNLNESLKTYALDQKFSNSEVPVLFWTAAAIGGKISAGRGNPQVLIQLPQIKWLLDHAITLDSNWNFGTLHAAMFSYYLSIPEQSTETNKVAVIHFNEALKASNGLDCSLYVSYAENISVKDQNKKEFLFNLEKAILIDPSKIPELYFSNIIAQSRAKWLMENVDELFY